MTGKMPSLLVPRPSIRQEALHADFASTFQQG